MGLAFSRIWERMFGKKEMRILMVGLDGHVLCGNQPVCRVHEEPASPRHRAGVASMAWRTTR